MLVNSVKKIFKFALFIFALISASYLIIFTFIFFAPGYEVLNSTINDVTNFNPVSVQKVSAPTSSDEIKNLIKSTGGAISIGGGRFSMGGQTAAENSLHLDMRSFNKVISFSPEKKEITVQPGISWRDLQEVIDPHNLSVKTMQSYSNFTVGGSLSVNCHGRYMGLGAIVHSIQALELISADGSSFETSRGKNPEIFFATIGGYGGLGVVTSVTLSLVENTKIEREVVELSPDLYRTYFQSQVENNNQIIMHNADIVPPKYDKLYVTNWKNSNKELTDTRRLQEKGSDPYIYKFYRFILNYVPGGVRLRPFLESYRKNTSEIIWRNLEASYDVNSLGKISEKSGSYFLQEYFVPVDQFEDFKESMTEILNRHQVQVVNISVRHAVADTNTYLSWSPQDAFAFVLYYFQPQTKAELDKTTEWTRELITSVIDHQGRHYLPYLVLATVEQFKRAYPGYEKYFAIKQKLDPTYKFRNKLWDTYYSQSIESKLKQVIETRKAIRSEVQTYLTLPEWLLVFMSEDQADATISGKPNEFAYFSAVYDFWATYLRIIRITKKSYEEINWGYHFMNTTIGLVTTIEYLLKGSYEAIVGRLTYDKDKPHSQIEDFIGDTFKEYASFIHQRPWYEFDFSSKAMMAKTIPTNSIREIERKISFLVELTLKSLMSSLFDSGTQAIYGEEDLSLYSAIEGNIDELARLSPEVSVEEKLNESQALIKTPRYEKFTNLLPSLKKYTFKSIAGNKKIATSYNKISNCPEEIEGELIYNLPTWNRSRDFSRIAKAINVESLISSTTPNNCITGVHVYDY